MPKRRKERSRRTISQLISWTPSRSRTSTTSATVKNYGVNSNLEILGLVRDTIDVVPKTFILVPEVPAETPRTQLEKTYPPSPLSPCSPEPVPTR